MPDDNNDRLMEQFIERATPKLLEAMQGALNEKIEAQIGGLKENSQKLLDQLKDAARERNERAAAEKADMDHLKALLERGDGPAAIKNALTPEPIRLTRTQARDAQLYRRAKAQAEKQGTRIEIVTDE